MRVWALVAFAVALGGAAPVTVPSKPESTPQAAPAAAKADPDGREGLSAYERESLAADRAANRIAESANAIARDQRLFALWQLGLGSAGVVFTGFAAFWAYRATHWAKEAAAQTKRSADADNAALKETRKAARDARKDAAAQEVRFTDQLGVAKKQVEVAEDTARKQLRAYVHAESIAFTWMPEGHPLFTITLMNTGQTPAINVAAGAVVKRGPVAELAGVKVPEDILLGRSSLVGPGVPFATSLLTTGAEEVKRESIGKANMLAVLGSIKYQDVFGRIYETEFAYFTTGPGEMKLIDLPGHRAVFREILKPD